MQGQREKGPGDPRLPLPRGFLPRFGGGRSEQSSWQLCLGLHGYEATFTPTA